MAGIEQNKEITMDQTNIDLRLFASLASQTPENAAHYPIKAGTTIAQLLEEIKIPLKNARIIFINGIRSTMNAPLYGGERVGIFPPIGGG